MKALHTASITLATAAALLVSSPGNALTDVPGGGLPTAGAYGAMVLPELDGVTSWNTLGKVESVKEGGKIVPQFDRQILALEGKEVRLQGFMLPMGMGKAQRHFLISAAPPSCPFCLPAGPEAVVEVFARNPVTYSMEPILVSGKFTLVKADPGGLLYRLNEANEFKAK